MCFYMFDICSGLIVVLSILTDFDDFGWTAKMSASFFIDFHRFWKILIDFGDSPDREFVIVFDRFWSILIDFDDLGVKRRSGFEISPWFLMTAAAGQASRWRASVANRRLREAEALGRQALQDCEAGATGAAGLWSGSHRRSRTAKQELQALQDCAAGW